MIKFSFTTVFSYLFLVEDNNNEGYETLKQNCQLYFHEMYFVFREFQKMLHGEFMKTMNYNFFIFKIRKSLMNNRIKLDKTTF